MTPAASRASAILAEHGLDGVVIGPALVRTQETVPLADLLAQAWAAGVDDAARLVSTSKYPAPKAAMVVRRRLLGARPT